MRRDSGADRYGRLFICIYACIELRGALIKGHDLKGPLLGFHG